MATSSVSGLVSGLDTATLVSQLISVERASQNRLKSRMASEKSTVTSLQELNSKMAALASQAADLAKTTGWSPVKVTSSSTQVSVAARADATAGSVSFTVQQRAQAHQLAFNGSAAMDDVVTGGLLGTGTTVRLDNLDGTTQDIETGDGTLRGLVNALNATGTGVRATTVKLDDGTYRLRVTSAATGAAGDFTLKNPDGTDLLLGATVTAGQDAAITVGGDTLHSATNTFSGVVSGLDITLTSTATAGTTVDVNVERDTDTMKASVKSFVDNLNAALTGLDSLTSYNAASKSSGPLYGDASVRTLRSALLSSVYPTDGSSLASMGVQLDRYGKLTFDEAAFSAAYDADPAAVRDAFATKATDPGFAARVQTVAKQASDSVSGTLSSSIKSRNEGITGLQNSIEGWDIRLELRKQTLTRQFSALETALSKLQNQSSWLSGQLAALNSSSS